MIGDGDDPRTLLMGFAMMFMSLLALPALMRFFTWTTGPVADAASGGGFLQTGIGGAVAIGALRGWSGGAGGRGPAEQAGMMASQLGPPAGGTQNTGPPGAASPANGTAQATVPTAPFAGRPASTVPAGGMDVPGHGAAAGGPAQGTAPGTTARAAPGAASGAARGNSAAAGAASAAGAATAAGTPAGPPGPARARRAGGPGQGGP